MKILITGAGGPAAICAFHALAKKNHEIHMADMSPLSSGLYFVKRHQRHILYPGTDDRFLDHLYDICLNNNIEVLLPTVDVELLQLSKAKKRFKKIGTKVLTSDTQSLTTCLNKYFLLTKVSKQFDIVDFSLLHQADKSQWKNKKAVVKPVSGSGSRGVVIYDSFGDIPAEKFKDETLMVQEFIKGPEYSVDVFMDQHGEPIVAVPRLRLKTDSGVSVTGMVKNDDRIKQYALDIAKTVGLKYMANIQLIDSPDRGIQLVEINPRCSGGLSLVVASGANIPSMAIQCLSGEKLKSIHNILEIAMVRSYQDHYMPANELQTLSC